MYVDIFNKLTDEKKNMPRNEIFGDELQNHM